MKTNKAAKVRFLEWCVVVANFYIPRILQTGFLPTFYPAISPSRQCTTIFSWKVFSFSATIDSSRCSYEEQRVKYNWNSTNEKGKENHKPDSLKNIGRCINFLRRWFSCTCTPPRFQYDFVVTRKDIRYEKELQIIHIIRWVIPSRPYRVSMG